MATHYLHKFASMSDFQGRTPDRALGFPIGSIANADGVNYGAAIGATLTDAAYGPVSHYDYFFSQIILTPTTTVEARNGLNSIRGEVQLTSGKTLGDGSHASYVVSVYGRANIFGTVDIGSGDLAAVYGKMDFNGSTLTSGHIAPVQSNIVNPPAAATAVDLFYGESAGGNHINSCFKAFAAANFAFDLSEVSAGTFVTTTAGASASKYLRLNLNGTAYKIALLADS